MKELNFMSGPAYEILVLTALSSNEEPSLLTYMLSVKTQRKI